LIKRAGACGVLRDFILSRERTPFPARVTANGRTFYRPSALRLFGRVHVDEVNTFALSECGFDGLFEVARICRMPLHTAARASIGTSMASLQFYQAIKDDVLVPRNKSTPEVFKSTYELLVEDRGRICLRARSWNSCRCWRSGFCFHVPIFND
jgi:hypothetical protein